MMWITAGLTVPVLWCLFYGQLNAWMLGGLCLLVGCALGLAGRHGQVGVLSIDTLAERSGLNRVHPALKLGSCLALLAVCICSDAVVGLTLAALSAAVNVLLGRVRLRVYLSLLAVPANFLLLSTLALLFEWSRQPSGVINLGVFGGWLCISAFTQARAALVLARALGAVSCLYLLSLSTPLCELTGVLRRARVPAVITDLMYLIYRYLFLLFALHGVLRDAAESRLAFRDFPHALRAAGLLYTRLLVRSFQRAGVCFDAMESRCFDEGICFLERERPLVAEHLAVAVAVVGGAVAFAVWRGIV